MRALMLVAAFVIAPMLATPARAETPVVSAETPASIMARRLVAAFTSGDVAAFLAFVHDTYPTSDRADADWLQQRNAFREIALHSVTPVSPVRSDAIVLVPARGDWLKLSVTVDGAGRITAFEVHRDRRPADVAGPPKLAPPEMAAAVRALAQGEAAADRFSGVVLIAKDGAPFYAEAFGMADIEARRANTLNTRFRFGSMGKMFTQVAIMQLVQAGKIDLAAPIGRYLPDYPNPDVAAQVTVDELMTHASGLGDIFNARFDAHREMLREPADYIALFGADPPSFTPGTRQRYSNYGYMVLGRIVEVVSGERWDDYFAAHIFRPAGMGGAGHRPEDARIRNRATAYWTVNGKPARVTFADTVALRGTPARPAGSDGYVPYRGSPGGGGYATAGDMLRFANALMGNRLLDAAHTQLLTTGTTTLPGGRVAPYDFSTPIADGRRYIGHAGGAPGQNGELRIFAEEGVTVVVLANRDDPAATRIARFISDRIP